MSLVRHFGATGDGETDDTDALQHALEHSDGLLELARGTYRLTRTLEIDLARSGPLGIQGRGPGARLLMTGPGPAVRLRGTHGGTAVPESVLNGVWEHERMPMLAGFEIVGAHPEADGVELVQTMQATLSGLQIRQVRNAIALRERNRNFLLTASHLYDNSGVGLLCENCNLHQAVISANHISYCRTAGLVFRGGDVHNVQITGNDIEYNYDRATPEAEPGGTAEILLDGTQGLVSEFTIASNTIQAVPSRGGANVRILGVPRDGRYTACLITLTGNVIGSQETNVAVQGADRVVLSGNTAYDGRRLNLSARGCRNLVVAAGTFGWAGPPDRGLLGGLLLEDCELVSLDGLLLEAVQSGAPQGGVITLINCRDAHLRGCQVLDPQPLGVVLHGCQRVRLSDCDIHDRRQPRQMQAAIELVDSPDAWLRGNVLGLGLQGAVIGQPPTDLAAENRILN